MMLHIHTVLVLVLCASFVSAWPKRRMGKFAHMFGKRADADQMGYNSDVSLPQDLQTYDEERLSTLELAGLLKAEDDTLLRYVLDLMSRMEEAKNRGETETFDV